MVKKEKKMKDVKTRDISYKYIARPSGLNSLKQFAQDIMNAIEKYEDSLKEERRVEEEKERGEKKEREGK